MNESERAVPLKWITGTFALDWLAPPKSDAVCGMRGATLRGLKQNPGATRELKGNNCSGHLFTVSMICRNGAILPPSPIVAAGRMMNLCAESYPEPPHGVFAKNDSEVELSPGARCPPRDGPADSWTRLNVIKRSLTIPRNDAIPLLRRTPALC
jgi:hypothetical protein